MSKLIEDPVRITIRKDLAFITITDEGFDHVFSVPIDVFRANTALAIQVLNEYDESRRAKVVRFPKPKP